MLGDIGRIPIISLSACKSLSDILSDLPLPQPLPKSVIGTGLIDDPQLVQEAQVHMQSRDGYLVDSILSALSSTSTDGIILKNDQKITPIDFHILPILLQEAISKKPNILEENRSFKCIYSCKEVLQILSGEAGKNSLNVNSPIKSPSSLAVRHQALGSSIASVELTQPQSPDGGSVYSVTSVEPLKLSIKRAPLAPVPIALTPDGPKKLRAKRRLKVSTSSGSRNLPMRVAESGAAPTVPTQQQIVQPPSVQSTFLPAPNPLSSVQLAINTAPSIKDPLAQNSCQMLTTVFNQLLHSDPDSTIASLLSSSDGQSLGTPASVEPHHPRSPPLSVPSTSSYPATPGLNNSVSVNNNSSSTSNIAPTVVKPTAPINAIFDTADVGNGMSTNPTPAPPPRGLAAYLQKSRQPEVVASPTEEAVDDYARQHGSVPPMSSSSPWTERRSEPQSTSNANAGAALYPVSSSLTNTPNGQEGGKEKRGRRRRSELEELINWQVRDQATPFKRHIFQSQQIPTIMEGNSPPHRGPSDNESVAYFTEPLGERVKRRRQQHRTQPSSNNNGNDGTRNASVGIIGDGGGGGKNGVIKRPREDTSSEVSVSPKCGKTRGDRCHHLTSSESDVPYADDVDEAKMVDDDATSSSCLTDSPVPRKHSIQRLVEEVKSRPPSLPRLDSLHHTPISSTPISSNKTTSAIALSNSNRHYPSLERPRRTASTRSSNSPPPLLPLDSGVKDLVDKKEHFMSKKCRKLIQDSSSEDASFEKSLVTMENKSMLSSNHNRSIDMTLPESHISHKKQKMSAVCSPSSVASLSSSNVCRPSPASSKRRLKNLSGAPSRSSNERYKSPSQSDGETSSTEPCTDSSAMAYDGYEKDELSCLKALPTAVLGTSVASSRSHPCPYLITTAFSDPSDSDHNEVVIEAEKRVAEEISKFATTWTHFSAHISEFLLRVGGLDLSKTAGDINITAVDPGEDFTLAVDRVPVEARLSRREVNALYHEAAEVRVAGSISNEPNGRLVRFLNLLRVNIRDASSLMAPNPTVVNFKDLIQRRKARIERRNGGDSEGFSGSSELLSESLLWSHPMWMRVLRGLDSALIALHIITGPDVPKGRLLAMEELVEAITAVTHFHFNRLVNVICTPSDFKRSGCSISIGLTDLVRECVCSRLSESLCGLTSLVRLHPGRFTDSLIMHLTDLAILVISSGLSPGASRKSSPPGANASLTPPSAILFPEMAPTPIPGESLEQQKRRQKDYCRRNAWRLQMQRAALALISTIFAQYDKQRYLVATDILSNLIATPVKAASKKTSVSSFARICSSMRNFWILATGSFSEGWEPFCKNVQTSSSAFTFIANSHFLRVHPFTAVLMAVIQGFFPAPSYAAGGRRSSSVGAPATPSSGVSQQSTATGTGMSDQHTSMDATQLAKEEKSMCNAFTNAIRTSQYLISEMFRKTVAKGEDNLSPLVDTIIIDLLRITADAPIEWPVASLLLTIFGKFLIQQSNGPTTTTASTQGANATASASNATSNAAASASIRSTESSVRQIALDSLVTLARGIYHLQKHRSSIKRTEFDLAEARATLSAFLASPVLDLYHLTLSIDDQFKREVDSAAEEPSHHIVQREFARELISSLRYNQFDGLTLAARRFHLGTWLHEVNQELGSTSPSPSEERRKQLEEIRKGLLLEFVSTHHSIFGIAPWLPPMRGAGSNSGTNNRPGLISPAASEPSLVGERSLSDTKLALYTGYGLGADSRRRKTTHAHLLATNIAAHGYSSIGFDMLYMQIVKLVHDASLGIRARALKGLSILVGTCPECIPAPMATESATPNPSDLLTIIPLRLMDGSPIVREAAVELAGHLVTVPNSIYLTRLFKPLMNRVLDMQISVRKRAIKSLQQLLLSDSEESQQTALLSSKQRFDACVALLRRSNDEDSIKRLVIDTFTELWFTSSTCEVAKASNLSIRVRNLCDVVLSVRSRGSGIVEEFMASILDQKSPEKSAQVNAASLEIVDFLIKIVQHSGNANGHTINCPLYPNPDRGRSSSPGLSCKCSAQLPDALSPSNVLSLLKITAKSRPQLFLQHIPLLVQIVSLAAVSQDNGAALDGNALSYVIEIIDLCCLYVASKKGYRLSQLFPDGTHTFEDFLVVLLQRHCRAVVDSSLSCLSAIINHHTKNYSRVTTCFAKFYECLTQESTVVTERLKRLASRHTASFGFSSSSASSLRSPLKARPKVLRAVYAVGLICKHFSLEDLANAASKLSTESDTDARHSAVDLTFLTLKSASGSSNRDEIFNTLIFFAETALLINVDEETRRLIATTSNEDIEMAKKAVAGLSFLANRYDYLVCSTRLQELFKNVLTGVRSNFPREAAADLQCIVLDCINAFLVDGERAMLVNDSNWLARRKQESLKELGDSRDSHGSSVAQIYLQTALEHCVICSSTTVRTKALSLIATAVRQGLVHPVSLIISLVSLQTDPEYGIRSRATSLLQEISQKYSGFLALKAAQGVRCGFLLQRIIASPSNKLHTIIRGAYIGKTAAAASNSSLSDKTDVSNSQVRPLALNHHTYTLLQGNRQHRRSFITSLASLFDMDYIPQSASQGLSPQISSTSDAEMKRSLSIDGVTSTAALDATSYDNGLSELIYVCDHLAHFPYKFMDEIHYLAHYLDLRISTIGSALVRSLQDCLVSSAQLKADSGTGFDGDTAAESLPFVHYRKVFDLMEDAESELFAKSTMPSEVGVNEQKILDRINRLVAADKRLAFRERVLRNGPACLLLMSIRKYLEAAFDATSSKLSSYSSSDDKSLHRPIPPPSARILQLGVLFRLVEIPAIVMSCALDPTWPRVSPNVKEVVVHTNNTSILDTTLLRLALLVHRQLLTVDGAEEEVSPEVALTIPPLPRISFEHGGGVAHPKKSTSAAAPIHRRIDSFKDKSHTDRHNSTKLPTRSGQSSCKKLRRTVDDMVEDGTGNLSNSLPSLLDTNSVRKVKPSGTKNLPVSARSNEKAKRHQPSSPSPSVKFSKPTVKPNSEGTASLSMHSLPSIAMPKNDFTTVAKVNPKKRLLHLSDVELSSLSSLEDDSTHSRNPPKQSSQLLPSPSSSKKAMPTPVAVEKGALPRPKYDLAPLPGTADILAQRERRRKLKAQAAKKAMEKHLLMDSTKKKKSQMAQPPTKGEGFRREKSSQNLDPDS